MDAVLTDNLAIDKSTWTLVKFGDVVAEPKESTKDAAGEGIEHVVGLEHIDSENIHLRRSAGIDESTTFTKKFAIGDVLFGRRRAYLKKAAQASFSGICSGDITVFRAKDNLIPELLPFIVNNDKFFDYAVKHSAGGLSPRVKFKALANYQFLLPPKAQQAQLAELLWAMDEVVFKDQEFYSKLDVSFNLWLNSKINTKNNWDRKPLYSVATVQTGVAKNKSYSNEKDVIKVPYLRVANVQDGFLDLSEVKSIIIKAKDRDRFLLHYGDLLLTEGGDFDKLGRGHIWQDEIQGCVHQNHVFAVRPNKENLLSWFLSLVTRSNYGKQYFLRCAKKTSNLASINSSQLKEFRVFVPPLSEQNKIVDQFQEIRATMEKVNRKITASRALQKSLINQIF